MVTDHKSVQINSEIEKSKQGPGYWKLNTAILHHQEYKDGVQKIIETFLTKQNVNCKLTWELFKVKIKEFSIAFSIKIAKSKREENGNK